MDRPVLQALDGPVLQASDGPVLQACVISWDVPVLQLSFI